MAHLFEAVAAATLAASLAGCGGGGDSAAPLPTPPPPPSPLAAVMSVPEPIGYDASRRAAFDRLNEIRWAGGLGLLAQSGALDASAQAHADWEIANDLYQHEELAGTPGFTGVDLPARVSFQGYASGGGTEVIAAGYAAREAVDGLVNVLYHRQAMLGFNPVDVGVGWSDATATNVAQPLVIDIARPADGSARANGQTAQARIGGLLVWPGDGARGVWTHMGGEFPDPVPDIESTLLGTPASISVDDWRLLKVATFKMTETATQLAVPTTVLTADSDPNALLCRCFVGLVPLQALKKNTSYRVDFSGAIAESAGAIDAPITRTWFFETGDVDFAPTGQ